MSVVEYAVSLSIQIHTQIKSKSHWHREPRSQSIIYGKEEEGGREEGRIGRTKPKEKETTCT